MMNLLCSEWFKLRKSRTFLVCCLLTVVMVAVIVGSLKMMQELYTDEMKDAMNTLNSQSSETGGASVTMTDSLDIDSYDGNTIMLQSFSGNTVQILETIFIAVFVIAEFSTGAVKNSVSKGYSRLKIYTAKYLMTVLGAEILAVIMIGASFGMAALVMGTDFITLGYFGQLMPFLGVQLLFNAALAGVLIMLSELFRNTGASIATGILAIAFLPLILRGIDLLFKNKISISKYWIMHMVSEYSTYDITVSMAGKAVLVFFIYGAVAFFIGAVHFLRTDIK